MGAPFAILERYNARRYTNAVLELVDEGVLDKDALIEELLHWMSESDVENMCGRSFLFRDEDNECIIREEEEEEDGRVW